MPVAIPNGNKRNGFVPEFDRRKHLRSRVRWQVRFLPYGGAIGFVTTTQNLSSGGFYCLAPVPLHSGDLGCCVLEVPTHRAHRNLLLKCQVRVLHVNRLEAAGICGVGCQIENYSLLRNPEKAESTASVCGEAS
jgi:PilZ domain